MIMVTLETLLGFKSALLKLIFVFFVINHSYMYVCVERERVYYIYK